MSQSFDVIVIGEGIAGLSAAGALAKAGLSVATFEQQLFGGLVINVNELDPAPPGGEAGGAAFAAEMTGVNAEAGVTSIQEAVTAMTAGSISTAAGEYRARHIIIASGAQLKKLGVPGEAEFEGRGVSTCADCDGPMFQNETVVVVGGGDSALQEAHVLTQYCGKVILVHRGPAFRAQAHFVDAVTHNDKIEIRFNTTVDAILGGQMVEKVRLTSAVGSEELPCAGVFAYIGLTPNTDFVPDTISRDDTGRIITGETLETALPGVWAIGAVRSGCGGSLQHAMDEASAVAAAIAQRR